MPRAQYRGTKTTAEVVAEVLARIGQQPLTAELIIQTFFETVIDYNKSGWKIEPMFDLLGFRFSVGGAHDDSGFPGTYDELQTATNCRMNRSILLALLLMLLAGTGAGFGADAVDELAKLSVPLSDTSEATVALLKNLRAVLAEVTPGKDATPRTLQTSAGIYVLHGDLFHTKARYALVAFPETELGFTLSEWTGTAWEPRSIFNLYPTWRPKGWKNNGNDYLPTTPAEKPFWLQDFSGDGVPEVIVAAEVEKYFQQHYLLKFDTKVHGLMLVAGAMAAPKLVDGWVRLDTNSGRRAIWGEWSFMKWKRDQLVRVTSWHEESPYNNIDPPFWRATYLNVDGKEDEFIMTQANSEKENESVYTIKRNGLSWAWVTFARSKSAGEPDPNAPSTEEAYLFEKLTGLPRKLYPADDGKELPPRVEKRAKIKVSGKPAAIRLLAPRP